jgi:hydroxymethylglutaryl-CoA synthase
MERLCAARRHDLKNIREVMMIDERGVNPPWEDPVTMAVNAALPMLSERDKAAIELLVVASESGVDQEKPMSTWVQRYLGLPSRCRNFEIKHACYGGTAGLQMAASWIATAGRGKKALVISTDQSRAHFGKPWEFVMGASAAALLVSEQPDLLEIEMGKSGIFTNEVSDLTRPTSRVETGNSETSLLSYLEALDGALTEYLANLREPVDYDYFKKFVYHLPFGGLTVRATRAALRHFGSFKRAEADAIWAKKTAATLTHIRRMGGTYSSSTFIGLLGVLEGSPDLREGDRIGMFSYGSGCCAEAWSGLLGSRAGARATEAGLKGLLDARYALTVREYEDAERERMAHIDDGDFASSLDGFDDWYEKHYAGRGYLIFRGISEHYRQYGWS